MTTKSNNRGTTKKKLKKNNINDIVLRCTSCFILVNNGFEMDTCMVGCQQSYQKKQALFNDVDGKNALLSQKKKYTHRHEHTLEKNS